jgi:hypothetical protein
MPLRVVPEANGSRGGIHPPINARLLQIRRMRMQADLVKTQLQAISEQTTELADAAVKTVVGVSKPKN